jgi:hypothetical protein
MSAPDGKSRASARSRASWLGALVLLASSACLTPDASVAVDGAEFFLLTRGADRRAPVLLWPHGVPGAAERPLFRYFNGELEQDFAVAYRDQRGAGRS